MFFRKKNLESTQIICPLDWNKRYFVIVVNGNYATIDGNLCVTDSLCALSSLMQQFVKENDTFDVLCRPLQYVAKFVQENNMKYIAFVTNNKNSNDLSITAIASYKIQNLPDMLTTLMKQTYSGFVIANSANNCFCKHENNKEHLVIFLTENDADIYLQCSRNNECRVVSLCWDDLGNMLTDCDGLTILDKSGNVLYSQNKQYVFSILQQCPSYPQFKLNKKYFIGKRGDSILCHHDKWGIRLFLAETEEDMYDLLQTQKNTTYSPVPIHLHSVVEFINGWNINKISLLAYGGVYDMPVEELLYRKYDDMLYSLLLNNEQIAIVEHIKDGETLVGSTNDGKLVAFYLQPQQINSKPAGIDECTLRYITSSELGTLMKHHKGLLITDLDGLILYCQNSIHIMWVISQIS